MVILVLLVLVGGAVGGGAWWARQHRAGDADTLSLPGSREIIAGFRSGQMWLDLIFYGVAGLSILLLASSGVVEVMTDDPTASIFRRILGGVMAGVPAIPLLVIGHFGADLWPTPSLPHDGESGDDPDRGPFRLAMAVGAVSFTGAALYGVSHLSALGDELGFEADVFGVIPQAWLIPFSVEVLLLFTLLAKMVRRADLAAVIPRAAVSLAQEVDDDLRNQEVAMKATLARLTGEAKAVEMTAEANRAKRAAVEAEAIEGVKFKAARATLKVRATEQAEQELEIDRLEAGVVFAERKHAAEQRMAAIDAEAEAEVRARVALVEQDATKIIDINGVGGHPKAMNGSNGASLNGTRGER